MALLTFLMISSDSEPIRENPLFFLVQDFLKLFADPRLTVGEHGWTILTILDRIMLSAQYDETVSTSSSTVLEEERSLFHSVDSKACMF